MTSHARTEPQKSTKWPYSAKTYVIRFFWLVLYSTIWKLCWKRIYPLRAILLNLLGSKVSLRTSIAASAWIEIPTNLVMKSFAAIGPNAVIYNLTQISIGERTIISQDAYICSGTHDYNVPNFPLVTKKIIIENDVWICAGAYIGPGVTVGEGAVVGARAVVTKDVPPWSVVAGNPAKIIKRRECTYR